MFSFFFLSQNFLETPPEISSGYLLAYLIVFWLHWVFIAAHRLSLVATNGGYFLIKVFWLLVEVASLIAEQALGTWASVVVTLRL